jgi:membrane protease YdiL (CAAX protease family)
MGARVDTPDQIVSTRALAAFFFGAVAWSWSCWFVAQRIVDPWATTLNVIGRFGPSAVAIIVVAIVSRRGGLRRFLSGRLRRRVSPIDALVAVFGPPVVVLVALAVAAGQGEQLGDFNELSTVYLVVPAFGVVLVLGGPLGEEIGWRGFALDPLQQRFGPVGASLVLGVLWALWHLPLFFDSDQIQHDLSPVLFLGQIMSTAVVYTWLWNRTQSLVVVMALHTSTNLSAGVFPLLVPDANSQRPFAIAVAAASLVAAALILITHSQLGWTPRPVRSAAQQPPRNPRQHGARRPS